MKLVSTRIVKAWALVGIGLSMFMLPAAAQAQQCDPYMPLDQRVVTIPVGLPWTKPLVFSGPACSDWTVTCEGTGEFRGTIQGRSQKDIPGVYIGGGAQRITVNNCIIEHWQEGIKLGVQHATDVQGGNHRIWHNVLRNNTKDGLDCDGSNANDYWDNEAYNNRENGFEFDNCHDSNDWSSPYIHENNRAHDNGKHGFSFDNSHNHRLHANSSYCNGWEEDCAESPAGENGGPGWESQCLDENNMPIRVYGHGLRIDSSDCNGENPSKGIQADWNNWGDDGNGCGSNAVAIYGYQVVVDGKLTPPKTGRDYAIIHCSKNDPLCQFQKVVRDRVVSRAVGDRGSTYNNMQSVYGGKNTNRCGPGAIVIFP